MRTLVEDEGDSSIPGGFQHLVPQALFVAAVVPLGEVTGTVRVLCGRPDLPAIHAATTAKPNTATRGRKQTESDLALNTYTNLDGPRSCLKLERELMMTVTDIKSSLHEHNILMRGGQGHMKVRDIYSKETILSIWWMALTYLSAYLGLFDHVYKVSSLLVVCVAGGLLVESEKFSEFSQREVTLHVLLLIHHTAAQGFLMGLSLQDLLLDRPRLSAHKNTQVKRGHCCSHTSIMNSSLHHLSMWKIY